MKHYLKVYKARLHVLSPTFVGNGKEISKKEYRLSYGDQKVIVYDPAKFYQVVTSNSKTRQYEDFLLNDPKSDLNEWLEYNHLNPDAFTDAIRYTVDFGDRLEAGNSKTQIMEFVKDPFGEPYVPGSSIKGMLRTILLGYEIKHNPSEYRTKTEDMRRYRSNKPDRKAFAKEAKSIESVAFNNLNKDRNNKHNAVNDVLQGLIVSDSRPLECSDLVLCQKIDYNTEEQEHALNIMRECVKSGVDIEFDLTIDTDSFKYDAERLMLAIKEFNEMYYDCFLSRFGSKPRQEDTVYLGGGVGYVSKTFIYPLLGSRDGVGVAQEVFKSTLPPRIFNEHGHGKDIKIGVSPHILKCTRYNGRRFQMGMCRFEMNPI